MLAALEMTPYRAAARREIVRKALHALGCIWAVWGYFWPALTIVGLGLFSVLYLVYEALRLRNRSVSVVEWFGAGIRRPREKDRLALGPLALALGIMLCFAVFEPRVACGAVLAVCGCDCAAGVAGALWGVHPLPGFPAKSVEGTVAGFVVAFLACVGITGLLPGAVAAAVASVAEALPLDELDNVVVPVATASALALLA